MEKIVEFPARKKNGQFPKGNKDSKKGGTQKAKVMAIMKTAANPNRVSTTIKRLLSSDNEKIALDTLRLCLEYVIGKPQQHLDIDMKSDVTTREEKLYDELPDTIREAINRK